MFERSTTPQDGESTQEALAPVTITPYRDGPYIVRGPFFLSDSDGDPIPVTRRTIALCRCGKSRIRPYCDGTHKQIDFRAPGVLETWPPVVAVKASDARAR